jgi:uncharacterized membrane protein
MQSANFTWAFSSGELKLVRGDNKEGWMCRCLICSPKKFGGAYCRRSVPPSELISPKPLTLSEIYVVDNKCSFRQGLQEQGFSMSSWKVQGHLKHIKRVLLQHFFIYGFWISSDIDHDWTYINYYLGQMSLKVIFERSRLLGAFTSFEKKYYFNTLIRRTYFITYYHVSVSHMIELVSCKCLSDNG